ncbi:MAG: hypothetical protein WAM91_07970 [Candidatus Acidiferrales bacterium]
MNRSIESRLKLIRIALTLCVVGAVGVIVSIEGAERFGFTFPRHYLLFMVLALAYCFFFLLWQLGRLKKKIK